MNKFLFAAALLCAPFFTYAQEPTPSFPSGSEAFSASPIPTASPAPKQIDSEKEKLIRALLARTKEVEMAQERMFQAMAGMKQMMPRIPERFWAKYRSLITAEELQNRLSQVYDQHFTTDELKSLIQVYDSPIGKKMSEEAVPILRESMAIALEISKRAGAAIASEFRAEQLLQQPRTTGSFNGMLLGPGSSPAQSATPTPASTPQ